VSTKRQSTKPRCGDEYEFGDGLGARSKQTGLPCRRPRTPGLIVRRQILPCDRVVDHTHGTFGRSCQHPRQPGEGVGAFDGSVGSLDAELVFARAKLASLQDRMQRYREERRNQPGDITGDGIKGSTYETWDQGARQWLRIIGDLESKRRQLVEREGHESRGALRELMAEIRSGAFERGE